MRPSDRRNDGPTPRVGRGVGAGGGGNGRHPGSADIEIEFQDLFRRYYRPVLGFFARKGFAPEDALDLTQETFLGIYKGLGAFRGESRIETWLYKVATTTYLKRLRASATAKRAGVELAYDEAPGGDSRASWPGAAAVAAASAEGSQLEEVLGDERRQAMRRAIADLPEQMRKCLTLRVYQEMTYREIATVMRLKIDTVKAHLFQARRKLRKGLDEPARDSGRADE